MKKYNKYNSNHPRVAICVRHDDEEPVLDNLAYTPSQMKQMLDNNIPISTQNAAITFDDGYRTLEFEPLIELQRGVDANVLWEKHQEIREKIIKAPSKAPAVPGEPSKTSE